MVTRHLLDQHAAAVILEHDEVAQQCQEPALLEHALNRHLQLGEEHGRRFLPANRTPRFEPLPAGSQRAEASLDAVRYHQHRVAGEQRREFLAVGLELVERRPDRGVRVGGILEFDDGQRQPVDEHDNVRAPRIPVFRDGELVDGGPSVGVGLIEVDGACLSAANGAIRATVFHRDAVHQQTMQCAVARLHGSALRVRELLECSAQRLLR